MAVYFIDETYDISNAEQLAQIEHKSRRDWAFKMMNFILKSGLNVWMSFDLELIENCSFGQRLKIENWINPAVVLMSTSDQFSLYIYRYYLFIYKIHFEQIHREFQFDM